MWRPTNRHLQVLIIMKLQQLYLVNSVWLKLKTIYKLHIRPLNYVGWYFVELTNKALKAKF